MCHRLGRLSHGLPYQPFGLPVQGRTIGAHLGQDPHGLVEAAVEISLMADPGAVGLAPGIGLKEHHDEERLAEGDWLRASPVPSARDR